MNKYEQCFTFTFLLIVAKKVTNIIIVGSIILYLPGKQLTIFLVLIDSISLIQIFTFKSSNFY